MNFDSNPNQYAGARWLVTLMKGKRKGHVGITLPGNLAVESVKENMFFFRDVSQIIIEKNIYHHCPRTFGSFPTSLISH
jgi:hypothetical protein